MFFRVVPGLKHSFYFLSNEILVRLMCSGLMRSGAGTNANSGPSNSLRPVWHGEGEETWRQRKVTFEANRLVYEGKRLQRNFWLYSNSVQSKFWLEN